MNVYAPVSPASAFTGGRIDDIECLRALAIIGVLVHHLQGPLFYWFPAWHPASLGPVFKNLGFWSGVDLFFVISGFVIARSLLPQLAAGSGGLRGQWRTLLAFWIRRAFRLLPSAWLWLGLILIAVVFLNKSGVFGSLHANLWATLAGMGQFANFRFADAFMRYEYGASFAYWTLSLEEQFYIVLPLAAVLLRSRLVWLLVGAIIVQAILLRTPLSMSLRTDAFAWGVLLAMAYQGEIWKRMEPVGLKSRAIRYVTVSVLVAVLMLLSAENLGARLSRHVSLVAIACVVLVWVASYGRGYICAEGRLKRLLLWIGSRSYAIYLAHIPCYFLVRELFWRIGYAGNPPPPYSSLVYATTAMLLTAALAEMNYRWVEIPLRDYGKRVAARFQSPRPEPVPAIAAASAIHPE